MKKLLFFLIATSLTIAANAQDPMNVNPFSDATVTIGGSGVPTTNGMVSKSKISSDPLYYCIVDDAKRLAEVTSKVRNAELKGCIVIPETVQIQGKTYKVVNIGENAFDGCTKITSIEIRGNALQKLCHKCFKGCTGLTEIKLNSNCCNLKSDAFVGCSNLKTIRASQKANNFSFSECNAQVVKY
ncbi:MAG: leucine-rich repeat protein [Bacteroidia bacterium]|mgnify:CR=1 FL=1|nr:leucine-rich repeat protein [Bacteroidia bacterium]